MVANKLTLFTVFPNSTGGAAGSPQGEAGGFAVVADLVLHKVSQSDPRMQELAVLGRGKLLRCKAHLCECAPNPVTATRVVLKARG
jgi:hypothetical protein